MIQRIQSLYLFLVFILYVCLFFFPIAYFKSYGFYIYGAEGLNNNSIINTTNLNYMPLIVLTVIIALLALIVIFLYKKRQLQIKIVRFNILINTLLVAGIFFYYIEKIEVAHGAKAEFTFFSAIPVITIILLILSMGAIYKDERLVRSSDRLR
jgi:hypothetical protein